MRLHKQYGHGLRELVNPRTGIIGGRGDSMDYDSDPSMSGDTNVQPTDNGDGTQTYNGVTFKPTEPRTFLLGLVSGL